MTRLRRLFLGLLLLALAGGRGDAALFGGEDKAFEAAEKSFSIGVWDRAEREFAQFIEKYPKSERRVAAVSLQAQALFQQHKFTAAVALLNAHQGEAGVLADQFLFWTGEAEFQNTNYPGAAVAFGKLAREFLESPRRLQAAVGEAAAGAKLGEWTTVVRLLQQPDGAFRQASTGLGNSELFTRGLLLLAEAQLAQNHFAETEAALKEIGAELTPELDWRRRHLLCRAKLGAGLTEAAEIESAGLMTAAAGTTRADWLAESVAFRADVLERLGRRDQAMATLKSNLNENIPVMRQRDALSQITALALALGQLKLATETLETFVQQFSNSPAADLALLTLGELYLKQYIATPDTNQLAAALGRVDQLITVFSNSPYLGRAQLNRGWCHWIAERYVESGAAFQAAADALPTSEDQAVARFKLADALFVQKDFGGALTNYRAVLSLASNWPAVNADLRTPALYQSLRASLELTNLVGAEAAMRGILEADPQSAEAGPGVLLVAQAWADARKPAEAQRLFREFGQVFPDSTLRAEVDLLAAQLTEQQSDWTNAVAAYDEWLTRYPTNNPLRAQAEFGRALAEWRSGNETNALARLTNFVAQFPTNELLAAQAQWWVADYYFNQAYSNQAQYQPAETSYKLLFQTWPQSELSLRALMMAGRAAMGWGRYENACEYFTNLTSNPNCPDELKAQALFAYGGALMRMRAAETNKLANIEEARRVFSRIVQLYPTNQQTAQAWGEIGNCSLQLATEDVSYYTTASNAFQQAIASPFASVAARSQAKVGLGKTLEKMAESKPGAEEKRALLVLARDNYLDVTLQTAEAPDVLFWQKKAGLEALRVMETLEDWCAVEKLCGQLQDWLPLSRVSFEATRERARKLCLEKSKPGS
jgi:TolA-binding protein